MQSPQIRDDKTLIIATSLARGLLALLVGGLALWGVDALIDLADSTLRALTWLLVLGAGAAVVARLARVGSTR